MSVPQLYQGWLRSQTRSKATAYSWRQTNNMPIKPHLPNPHAAASTPIRPDAVRCHSPRANCKARIVRLADAVVQTSLGSQLHTPRRSCSDAGKLLHWVSDGSAPHTPWHQERPKYPQSSTNPWDAATQPHQTGEQPHQKKPTRYNCSRSRRRAGLLPDSTVRPTSAQYSHSVAIIQNKIARQRDTRTHKAPQYSTPTPAPDAKLCLIRVLVHQRCVHVPREHHRHANLRRRRLLSRGRLTKWPFPSDKHVASIYTSRSTPLSCSKHRARKPRLAWRRAPPLDIKQQPAAP